MVGGLDMEWCQCIQLAEKKREWRYQLDNINIGLQMEKKINFQVFKHWKHFPSKSKRTQTQTISYVSLINLKSVESEEILNATKWTLETRCTLKRQYKECSENAMRMENLNTWQYLTTNTLLAFKATHSELFGYSNKKFSVLIANITI